MDASLLTETTWILGDQFFIMGLLTTILAIAGAALLLYRMYFRKDDVEEIHAGFSKTRFRKRDKVLFYGKKMLRKVRSISSGPNKKRRIISKITRKLLQKDMPPTRLHVLEPSAEYLQEDLSNKQDQRLPPDVAYVLQSIRMFGIFERPLFLELCKHMETMHLLAGQFLFRIGDDDENFFVVESGRLKVFITEPDGTVVTLKIVKAGDSIASLLSFTDVLTGHPQPLKTVSAQAIEEARVLKLPVAAFQEVFEKNPEIFVRVIQIIMVRLSRVTLTALHQHLGLSQELVLPQRRKSVAYTSSPSKRGNIHMFHQGSMDDTSKTPDLLDSDGSGNIYATQSAQSMGESFAIPVPITSSGIHLRKRGSSFAMPTSAPNSFPGSEHRRDSQFDHDGTIPSYSLLEDSSEAEAVLKTAINAFKVNLRLDDDSLLQDCIHLRDVPAGAFLAKEDSQQDTGLVYVVHGLLTAYQREDDREVLMYNAYTGEFVGGLSVLTGEPSAFTVRAKHNTRVAIMPSSSFYSIMSKHPKIVLHVAHLVVKRLSPFVRQIDFAMDWIFCESGRALYRQGDDSDSTFIVLSGRLRSVITRADGKKQLVGEYGRGDLVGIVETLSRTPRSTTVMAVRDSELAKLPQGLLDVMKLKYPIVVTRLINLLAHRILGSWQKPSLGLAPDSQAAAAYEMKPSQMNFSTVAVLAVSEDVPLSAFSFELLHSLTSHGSTLRLNSDYMKRVLGTSIMETANEYKLSSWLAQQEDKHRIVLYQCDYAMTLWTQRCIRQADCIFIVGMGKSSPTPGKVEKQLEHLAVRTQKELVLLYRESEKPNNTTAWLNARQWCFCHHHIQCPKRMFSRKAKMSDYFSKICQTEPNIHSDFSRLARWLTGTSVGLVLGGGGARGAAHIGLIKAIQEAGIPIDMVGGVSIGAFMGGLYCMERNIVTVTQKARDWSRKMTQWWRQIWDLTYPVTSMFTGAGFNQILRETFGDVLIEDLWLPYFTVTTDISSSSMRVHTHGTLWRYVRASMTLTGYFPPICDPTDGRLLVDGGYINNLPAMCDPEDGHLLVDGCYINNVPADVMRNRGARYILAVDVGSQDDTDLTNYGDSLSGWWLLWQKWTSAFRSDVVKVPNLPDIQSRLAYVSCVRQLEEVRNKDYCHYVRPPIDKFKTLQFGSFDEIKDVGYNHGKTYFDGMMKGGSILNILGHSAPASAQRSSFTRPKRTDRPTSGTYNFTDLAQIVCNVKKLAYDSDVEESEEEGDYEYDGYTSEPAFPKVGDDGRNEKVPHSETEGDSEH